VAVSQKNNIPLSPTKKIVLSTILVLLIAAVAGLWYWNTHKKEIIRSKIEKAIASKRNGLYKVEYDDLQLDEVAGYLSINNMRIEYDSIKFDSLKRENSVPSVLLKINIPQISLSGVKTPRALIDKEIVARKLEIVHPTVEIFYTNAGKDSLKNMPSKEIYEQILGELNLIKVDSTILNNATIITKSIKKKRDSVVFKNANILLTDVIVDSTSNADSTRFLFAKGINFACDKISWSASSNLYKYSINNLKFNSTDKNFTIQHVSINPQLSEDAFAKAMRFQSDRLDIDFNDISIQNVNMQQLMNEVMMADNMKVKSGSIKAYRDLSIPRDTKNRSGTYPHQQVSLIPIEFVIPKAMFSNIFIQYREKNDISKQVGDVRFYNCDISINNLTNESSALQKNNICRIDVTSSLLNIAPMKAALTLHLEDKQGRFSIEGSSAGSLDAAKLNQLAVPMALAEIKEGNLKNLDFKLTGNNIRADGSVTVLYDNLDIDFLEMGNDQKLNKKHLTSFISNFILKKSNPDDGETRVGEVHHERDMNRSFYNLIWKSIFEGISKSIGNKRKMKRP
jgi:hypothetical protein